MAINAPIQRYIRFNQLTAKCHPDNKPALSSPEWVQDPMVIPAHYSPQPTIKTIILSPVCTEQVECVEGPRSAVQRKQT